MRVSHCIFSQHLHVAIQQFEHCTSLHFLVCWGRRWNEFCHTRLKTTRRQENFHYYRVVFKPDDDLQGLRTEGLHFLSPLGLANESDGVW